jgi:hypothetical protein
MLHGRSFFRKRERDMGHRTLSVGVIGLAMVVGASAWATAQSGPSALQGAWTIQDVSSPQPPANPRNKPTGLALFSGTHFSMVGNGDSTRPALPQGGAAKATADQLRATWGPLVMDAGTFAVTGNTIRLTGVIAKGPAGQAPGNFSEWSFTLKGDQLVMTQVKNQNGPFANPVTLRLARAK